MISAQRPLNHVEFGAGGEVAEDGKNIEHRTFNAECGAAARGVFSGFGAFQQRLSSRTLERLVRKTSLN
jgi:hypothetical protein